MRIAFYGCHTYTFNPDDVYGKGVGGSELSLTYMARALAERGHHVGVFINTDRSMVYYGAHFGTILEYDPDEYWDVVVAFRGPLPPRVNSRACVHWSIDPYDPFIVPDLPRLNGVLSISTYQAATLAGVPIDLIRVTRLCVDPREYQEQLPKEPFKMIYCSEPERGFRHLPPIFALIKQAVPQAELVITFDHTLWGLGQTTESWGPLVHGMPGICYLGKLSRAELIRQQKISSLHLHPCDGPLEMFCIAALECQAAGTPTIATDQGALATTVAHGVSGLLIRSLPEYDPHFYRRFASTIITLLTHDRGRLAALSSQGRERALNDFSFPRVAAEWEDYFAGLMQ